MNRNVESHFAHVPRADIERSIFDRSHTHKTSFNVGELIPIDVQEILPGDSVKMRTSKVVRLQTMLTPIMDNVYLDTYWFFVPNRLIWSHWKNFCGESESAWASQVEYTIPQIKTPSGGFAVGTIADYMGVPVGVDFYNSGSGSTFNALPFRGYSLICSEFFRDQNLMQPCAVSVGDSVTQGVNTSNQVTDLQKGGGPFLASKYHDYFTSALPGPLKAENQVTLDFFAGDPDNPSHGYAEVRPMSNMGWSATDAPGMIGLFPKLSNTALKYLSSDSLTAGNPVKIVASSDTATGHFVPTNLYAQLNTAMVMPTINDLRLAFQLQRFYERQARGGTRYIELVKSHFGVTSPDARLQRPEYLGGNRIALNVHEVTNNAQSESDFLGDLGAKSVTSDVHYDFEKSFTEHGYLYCLCVVRYDHTYHQGFDKLWLRNKFTDFYWPVFAHLGEMPIYKAQIYAEDSGLDKTDIFGYQEAWAEYRYAPNRVSSEMRPGVANSLASWHLADQYAAAPTLSSEWIAEDKTNVDRVLAVTSANANQIFADFYFDAIWTRPMPMYSVPGLIDHF